jgi:hypothetical protein
MKVKALKHYLSYTSRDNVTIPKELYKTHGKKASTFAVNKKSNKAAYFYEGMQQNTCNLLHYFKCHGFATVTSYCYSNITKMLLVATKK